jgi:hypothetical protein
MPARTTVFLAVVLGVALAAAPAGADDPLHLAGRDLPADGALATRAAEVVGGTERTVTPVLAVDAPEVHARRYRIVGRVAYTGVEGEGFLEMWSQFPDGGRYVSRTLEASGPRGRLTGSSPVRPFELPFTLASDDAPRPARIELDVVLPGPGRVTLSGLRLESIPAPPSAGAAWWSERAATWAGALGGGAIGILGATLGVLGGLGRGRRFVLGTLAVLAAGGLAGLALGVAGLLLGQPQAVWYPAVLLGGIASTLGLALRGTARRHYAGGAPLGPARPPA